jgi:hypothetical protein
MYAVISLDVYNRIDWDSQILNLSSEVDVYFLHTGIQLAEIVSLKQELNPGQYYIVELLIPADRIAPNKFTEQFITAAVAMAHKIPAANPLPLFVNVITVFNSNRAPTLNAPV